MRDLKTVLLLALPVLLIAGGILLYNELSTPSGAPIRIDGVRGPAGEVPPSGRIVGPSVDHPRGSVPRPDALPGATPEPATETRWLSPELLRELLAQGGPDAWRKIRELIENGVTDAMGVQALLVETLGESGNKAYWSAQLLPFIKNEEARAEAARALLSVAAETEDAQVLKAAVLVVGQLAGGEAAKGLADLVRAADSSEKSSAALMAIALLRAPESAKELAELFAESLGTDMAHDVLRAISRLGTPEMVAELAPHLAADAPREAQLAAVRALGLTRSASAVGSLKEYFARETDRESREVALLALGRVGDKSAVEELVRIREEGGEMSVAAGLALANVERQDAVQPLLGALETETDDQVRVAIIKGLGNTESREAAANLRTVLRSGKESQAVRGQSASALARIGDAEAVGPMVEILRSSRPDEENLQIHVIRALIDMGRHRLARAALAEKALPELVRLSKVFEKDDRRYYYTHEAINRLRAATRPTGGDVPPK